MSKAFRPMLAADISDQLGKLRYPVYATPKLDGVRAIIRPDGVWSRTMKLIPNRAVQELAEDPRLHGLDGELIAGPATAPDVYRRTQRACATADSDDQIMFHAFDMYSASKEPYKKRHLLVLEAIADMFAPVVPVPSVLCSDEASLLAAEEHYLNLGYEGLILRSPDGEYKNGRSTVREQGMLKLKRFVDSEAEIIGVEEEMENTNAAKTSALGLTERSSHKAGLRGKGRMGALIVRDVKTGVEFKIGSGFTAEDRDAFWLHRHDHDSGEKYFECVGLVVKYKSFAIGVKDKPRFPVYLGMREGWDRI